MVADIITGRDVKRTSTLGTAIVGVFGLAAASVGWSEKRAVAAGKNIRVIHTHPASHAGYYPGAAQLHLKLVVDADTDAILGAQAVGEDGADKRIDVIATTMRAGLSATDLADLELAYSPQYGSAKDPVNLIGMVNDNIRSGERSVQWHELDAQIADGWTLVDVRTAGEFAAGNIPGAINIPVDELREHLDELQGKNVLVHCQVGLRGHVAATLLTNSGINAANLDGGYLTWKTATS
ncbi:putative oxidase [Corynebacterium diphtheriae HC02]|nr:putative oxidase [Corynebacterium diphtheriae HC02]